MARARRRDLRRPHLADEELVVFETPGAEKLVRKMKVHRSRLRLRVNARTVPTESR